MRRYAGLVSGDQQAGGGAWINNGGLGHELFNFASAGGQVRGFVQTIRDSSIALERIDPSAQGSDNLGKVTVVFFAPHPEGRGQVVVGWYHNARVRRDGVNDAHLKMPRTKNRTRWYQVSAKATDAVLLPPSRRTHRLPVGAGGIGQSCVCYPLRSDGSPKPRLQWMRAVLELIDHYSGPNLMTDPAADIEDDVAALLDGYSAVDQGAGFLPDAKQGQQSSSTP